MEEPKGEAKSKDQKKKRSGIAEEVGGSPIRYKNLLLNNNETTKEESYISQEEDEVKIDGKEAAAKKGDGFFAENFRNLIKSQKQIEDVVELLNIDQLKMGKVFKKQRQTLNQFLKEL